MRVMARSHKSDYADYRAGLEKSRSAVCGFPSIPGSNNLISTGSNLYLENENV